MFWKIVKTFLKQLKLFRHPHQLPITLRLTAIYTLSAFGLLTLISILQYWNFTNRLEQQNYQFLQSRVIILQNLLKNPSTTPSSLYEETVLEPPLHHYYSRLIDTTGKTLLETVGMNTQIPTKAFTSLITNKNNVETKYWILQQPKGKKHFFLIQAYSNQGTDKLSSPRYIQIALDVSKEHRMLREYQGDLARTLLIGIIGSALLGFIIAHKALKPLREITRSTEQITVAHLKERFNPTSWPWELSSLANAFNHMLDRIESGFLRLSQFSGDLAHELRTPITNLIGEAEIALSRPRSNEEYRQVLESSLEEFARVSYMIENLLFLARAENPQTALVCSKTEINPILKNVVDFYEAVAEEKNIKIHCEGNGYIQADQNMLRRVLTNLIGNALRHTSAKGNILLSAKSIHDGMQINVIDNGEGIPNEHLPHLCDRFYRVDTSRTYSAGGTGLGLAIVKSVMELHQGSISIISEINKGTTVTLFFPSN